MAGERRVLVVEDEPTIAASVAARLRAEGFAVDVAHDGPSAVAKAGEVEPDVVVLDVMLPGFDGLEVCRRLHAHRPVPVLMLTARDAETDVLVGLAVGADDYMTKPFSVRELVARVHALLRRTERTAEQAGTEQRIVLGELRIDLAERAGSPAAVSRRTSRRPSTTCCCTWRSSRARCCTARPCWPRSGAGRTARGRARSTAMSKRCAASSVRT
jgi:DNA-binding response OmpR family regulator